MLFRSVLSALSPVAGEAPAIVPLIVALPDNRHLSVHAVPVVGAMGRYLRSTPMVLLSVAQRCAKQSVSADAIRHLYGCTRSEARLAGLLAEGHGLRAAADAMGITYGSARAYLKLVFDKVGVHSQGQLVARLMADMAGVS